MSKIIPLLVLVTAPVMMAASPPPLVGVLDKVGGGALPALEEAKNSPGLQPLLWPMRDEPQEVAGSRYFAEKRMSGGMTTAERARDLFAEQRSAEGGRIETPDSCVAQYFANWTTDGRMPTTGLYKHRWVPISSVCTAQMEDRFLGGYYAAVYDTSTVALEGDLGSRAMMRLLPVKTLTAVYIFRGEAIGRPSQFAGRRLVNRGEQLAALREIEDKRTVEMRANLKVGTETNCGTVIEIRPPLAQIAVPPFMKTPNGQATFWSRIDRLIPAGIAVCTFGML